jgi:hypothetical protein
VRKLFGMAVRRKAPVILATVLTLAIAGTALASVRGTTLKMGVTNILTGNYITAFYATVAGPALLIRNGSTSSLSSAIRAWAPYGGTPLDLVARAGFPVMKVSNTVPIANLNADLVDSYSANGLTRAARAEGTPLSGLQLTTNEQSVGLLTIAAPSSGFVLVNGTVAIDNQSGTPCRNVPFGRLRHIQSGAHSNYVLNQFETTTRWVTYTWTYVFPVSAGTNTFDTRLRLDTSCTGIIAWYWQMTGQYGPFGSTGTGALGASGAGTSGKATTSVTRPQR